MSFCCHRFRSGADQTVLCRHPPGHHNLRGLLYVLVVYKHQVAFFRQHRILRSEYCLHCRRTVQQRWRKINRMPCCRVSWIVLQNLISTSLALYGSTKCIWAKTWSQMRNISSCWTIPLMPTNANDPDWTWKEGNRAVRIHFEFQGKYYCKLNFYRQIIFSCDTLLSEGHWAWADVFVVFSNVSGRIVFRSTHFEGGMT